jgi:hypothetical protein
LARFDTATLGGGVHQQVHVAGLAVKSGQPGLGVGAYVPDDLFESFEVPSGGHRVPVPRHENQREILCLPLYVEDLSVRGLARTRLAKSVHDAGWSSFTGRLEYKAKLYGREFRKIGRWEPASQVCSACGVKDGPKPLAVVSGSAQSAGRSTTGT